MVDGCVFDLTSEQFGDEVLEYIGPLYEQIDEVLNYVYCHRNMTDESCEQVTIYDDRLD